MGYSEKCKKVAGHLGVDLSACKDIFLADVAKAMGINFGPGERLTIEMVEEMADDFYPEGIACNQDEDISVEPFAASVDKLLERMGIA